MPFLLAPLILWSISVIIFALHTKVTKNFSVSGIKKYHIILAVIILAVSMIFNLVFVNELKGTDADINKYEDLIKQAETAQTPEEINQLYNNYLKQIDHPYWQSLLQNKIAENKNTPSVILEDLYKKYGVSNFGIANVDLDEALLKNTSTPDSILLEFITLPVVPGHAVDAAEKIRMTASTALISRGYKCSSYYSNEERKPDGEIISKQLFFKCNNTK